MEIRRTSTLALLHRIYTNAVASSAPPVGMTRQLIKGEFGEFWQENIDDEDGIGTMSPARVIYIFLHFMLARHFPHCSIDPILRELFKEELSDELPDGINLPLNHKVWSDLRKERKEKEAKERAKSAVLDNILGVDVPEQEGQTGSGAVGGVKREREEVKEEKKAPAVQSNKLKASLLLSRSFNRALAGETPPLGMTDLLLTREFYEFWEANPPSDEEVEQICIPHILYVFLDSLSDRHFPDGAIGPIIDALFEQELVEGVPGTQDTPLNNTAWVNRLKKQKARILAEDAARAEAVQKKSNDKAEVKGVEKKEPMVRVKQEPEQTGPKGKQPMKQLSFEPAGGSSHSAPLAPAARRAKKQAPKSGMGWRPSYLAAMSASRTARPRGMPSIHMQLRSSLSQQLPFKESSGASSSKRSEGNEDGSVEPPADMDRPVKGICRNRK